MPNGLFIAIRPPRPLRTPQIRGDDVQCERNRPETLKGCFYTNLGGTLKLARCRELLSTAVTPQPDTAPTEPDPSMPPGHETTVAPTRVCPRCGAGRMVVVAEFPPMSLAEWITAGLEPFLIVDSS